MPLSPRPFGPPNPARLFRSTNAANIPPAAGGTTYNDTLSESGAAADSYDPTTATFPNALAESGAAGDALTSAAVFPNALSESGSSGDAIDATATYPAPLSEAGSAADALSAVQLFAQSFAEVGAAVDVLSALGVWPNDLAELGGAADAVDAAATYPADLQEAAAAQDTVDSPLPAVYDDVLVEMAFASDAYATDTPPEQLFGNVVFLQILRGKSPAVYDERLNEVLRAEDDVGAFAGWMERLNERATAADALESRAAMRATVREALAARDALRGSTAIPAVLSEPGTAVDALEARGFFNPSDEILALSLLLDRDLIVKRQVPAIDRDRERVVRARDGIQRAVGEFFAHLSLHLAAIARGIRKAGEEDDPVTAVVKDIDWRPIEESIRAHNSDVAKDAAEKGLHQVGVATQTSLSQANERAASWASDRAGESISSIEETTRDGVRALVTRSLDEGWTPDELADALMDAGVFSASRAEAIARTEVAASDIQGNLIGWKESGVVAGKEWKTGGGACDECEDLDGEVVDIDDEFPEGDPPLHPNCRCDVLPVLGENEE